MFELKPLTPAGIERALQKVERYRLLNEPWEAESICRDVLELEPENQEALISLLLSLTDQFQIREGPSVDDARAILPRLGDPYHRAYYAGIICERKGTAVLRRNVPGTGPITFRWLREAMGHYEEAQASSPAGNEDAIVRWNTCARVIMLYPYVQPASDPPQEIQLE